MMLEKFIYRLKYERFTNIMIKLKLNDQNV